MAVANKNRREPSYDEAVKTIKRSILARGGMSERSRVQEAIVWNFYTHLTREQQRKMDIGTPYGYDPYGWVQFRRHLLNNSKLAELAQQADNHITKAVNEGKFIVVVVEKDGKRKHMLAEPETKIVLGA